MVTISDKPMNAEKCLLRMCINNFISTADEAFPI